MRRNCGSTPIVLVCERWAPFALKMAFTCHCQYTTHGIHYTLSSATFRSASFTVEGAYCCVIS
eukprot:3319322-Pleurochrysis_carterae.AAC.3